MNKTKKYLSLNNCRAVLMGIALLAVSVSGVLAAKTLNVEVGDAQVIKFEQGVSEIFLANPDVADVQLSNPTTAFIYGKTPGATKFIAMGKKGKEVLSATVIVSHNLTQLKQMIEPFDPHGLVELKSIPGAIVLEGQVDSPKTAEEIRALAQKFLAIDGEGSKGPTKSTVINRLTIKSPVQVNLRVKVAEVSRNVLNQIGINWQAAFSNIGDFNFAALTGRAPFTPIVGAGVGTQIGNMSRPGLTTQDADLSTLGFNFTNNHVNLNAAIDLLSKDGLVSILAEPNLTAISGETATFLAGGEFPFPVPQQLGNITIEFKQYGVSLSFTPTVLDGRLISLRVRPEVSELDESRGITILGTRIPGILTRRAETTVELGSGQTFAIAGLLASQTQSTINALPGLGDLPILGPLFRSNRFKSGESELVILITPYLVEPTSGKEMMSPLDGLHFATFVEQIFERKIVKQGTEKGKAPAFGPGGARLVGPAGFSIE